MFMTRALQCACCLSLVTAAGCAGPSSAGSDDGRLEVLEQQLDVGDDDGARLLGALTESDVVASDVETEAGVEALSRPDRLVAGELGDLRVDLARRVPQQPGDRVVVPTRMGVEVLGGELRAQVPGGVEGALGEVEQNGDGIHDVHATPRGRIGCLC